jgi:putative ABC transport system permease protein
MWQLLRRVSLRDYAAAPGRLTLMVGGIAVGVSLIAALGIINASVLSNFRTSLERAAGKAALQVALGTGEIGFDEATLATVSADPDVEHAFGVSRGTLVATDVSGEVLQLFGIDLTSEAIDSYDVHAVGEEEIDQLEMLNDPSSVLLAEDYARRHRVAVGDHVRFATPTGIQAMHVRGLLRPEGMATVFGGNLAVMDLPAAQRLLGKDGRVDQIDVLLRSDRAANAVRDRLSAALPSSLTVERPAFRGERFERAISAFQAMLNGLSLLCLLAGVFIVYNTAATAVTQRARDLAILIAVGADRSAIRALVVTEAAILGFVASVLGIAIGYGLAHMLLQLVAQSMGVVYQARFTVESFTLTYQQIAWYLFLGVFASAIAAWVPAEKARTLDPLDLMRADFREKLAITAPNRLLLALAAGLLVLTGAAVVIENATRSILWGNVGASLLWIAAVVLSIPFMSGISALLRRWLPRLLHIEGRIVVESLTRSPGRTGVTTAVIALSLTLAVTVSSVALSFRESERNWFILMGDLVVSSVGTEGGWLETPLSAGVGHELGLVPGVRNVETYRVVQGQEFRDARIAVVAVSPGFIDTTQFRRQVVAGDADDAIRRTQAGSAVIVSDNLAERFALGVGDEVDVPTPAGPERMMIAGVVSADYSGDQGSIVMSQERFATLWGDSRVSHFNVFLDPGGDLEAARLAILQALGTRYFVKVLTVPQTLAYHQGMVDRAFVFTYAIQLLVVAVTLAGIFDLLTTQIIERRQEIGIFRAVGADETQVSRSIRLEALVIGLAGAVLGSLLAVGTSLLWVRVNFRILIGYILEYHFPLLTALWCVVLASGVAIMAGQLAARRALRQSVLDSLRYE